MRIKVGDTVRIIAGNERGSSGRILSVDLDTNKVVVEGINLNWRHVRRSQKNPRGGRVHKELPIDGSNVMLICPSCAKPTRVSVRRNADQSKDRVCAKCEAVISQVAPSKSRKGAAK